MANEPVQNYQNHIRHDVFLYVYLFILLLAVICAAVGVFMAPVLVPIAVILNVVGTVFAAINARQYATKLQDRIVRTEMQLRLKEAFGGDPQKRVRDFSLGQLIALRFAGDDELAELANFVLDENITDKAQIKQMVKNWKPDHLRV